MEPPSPQPAPRITNGVVFALVLLLHQVLVCCLYGFLFGYNDVALGLSSTARDEAVLLALMTVLVLVGFGLINSYLHSGSFTGMAATLLIFVLTLENYFLMKALWEKAGVSDPQDSKSFASDALSQKISFINTARNRFDAITEWSGTRFAQPRQFYPTYSLLDAIACSIANAIALGSVIDKIKFVQMFFLALIGTFIYQVNEQLLWRYAIYDTSYGMRIFIFGGFAGIISKKLLDKAVLQRGRSRNEGTYIGRTLGVIGGVVCFCTFPTLTAANLFQTTTNDAYILDPAVLRMFLAMMAGVMGSVSASCIWLGKIMVHDFIFSGLAGGIAYSSSCALHENPGIPILMGFGVCFVLSTVHGLNFQTIIYSGYDIPQAFFNRHLLAGIAGGVLSAMLAGIDQGDDPPYTAYMLAGRSAAEQAGYQMAGVGLSLGLGAGAGVLLGLGYRLATALGSTGLVADGDLFGALDQRKQD